MIGSHPSLSFYSFPIDPDRRKSWLVHLHRQKWKPSSHSRVCSDHFIESDIDRTGQVVRLRTEAIPTRLKNLPKHLRKVSSQFTIYITNINIYGERERERGER